MDLLYLWLSQLLLLVLVVLALRATRTGMRREMQMLKQQLEGLQARSETADRTQVQLQMRLKEMQQQLVHQHAKHAQQLQQQARQIAALQSLQQQPVRLHHLAELAGQGQSLDGFVARGQLSKAEAQLIEKIHAATAH